MSESVAFADLALAAYCPRKLHYARTDDREPPPEYERALDLATTYPDLLVASDAALSTMGLAVSPAEFRTNLRRARRSLADWPSLTRPAETDAFVAGKDAHGRISKVLSDPPVPALVSPGSPPKNGVWAPQSVRAVAMAKALSWREQTTVERAIVEYPRHGIVREIAIDTRRTAAYRRTLATARAIDGPPPRLHDDAKCGSCEYASECGVKTRSLRSLLSLRGGS